MTKNGKNLMPVALVIAGGIAIAIAVGATSSARTSDRAEPARVERVHFAFVLPATAQAKSIGYVVRSARNELLASGSIPAVEAAGKVTADLALPAGANESATFIVNPSASGASVASFIATQTFDVGASGANQVEVASTRFAPFAGGASTGSAPGGVAAAAAAAAPNCQACELASDQGRCDPELLTAAWTANGNSASQGWGCDTLASAPEKAACASLLHCLTTTRCAEDDLPVAKCFCGSASSVPCFAGEGVDGPCVTYYRAAAAASAGGPGPTATNAEVARFVATYATNPKTAVGLADNLDECAFAAHCDVCSSL